MSVYINLMSLDGIEITDHGRTCSENREERAVSVQLASGKIKKYVMGEKKNWTLTWTWLPGSAALTTDGFGGRDSIRALAYGSDTYTLVIRNSNGIIDTYTVFIEDYSEELVRRDLINSQFFYNVSLTLKEQ